MSGSVPASLSLSNWVKTGRTRRTPENAIARPGRRGDGFGAVLLIDSHIHLYPPDANRDPAAWAEARGETHWAKLSTRRRANGPNNWCR